MERWLFLQDEPIERIYELAFGLDELFKNQWDFSEFVHGKTARESRPDCSLEKCFDGVNMEGDIKLVIGQRFFREQQIRLAFRYDDIWADFMTPLTPDSYTATDKLFENVFGSKIENYSNQDII